MGVADLIEEVVQHAAAVDSVVDFGVELHAVEAARFVADGHIGAIVAVGDQSKALGHLFHIVAVAHPGDALLGQILEELAGGVEIGFCFAVLPGGSIGGGSDGAAQRPGHQLAAVADTQHGHAQFKQGGIHVGRRFFVYAAGAAGENDADGGERTDLLQGHGVGMDLTVYVAFADAAGDQLVILAAEIQDQYFFVVHAPLASFCVLYASIMAINLSNRNRVSNGPPQASGWNWTVKMGLPA